METKNIPIHDGATGAQVEKGLSKLREIHDKHSKAIEGNSGSVAELKGQLTELTAELRAFGEGAPNKVEAGEVKSMIDAQVAGIAKAQAEAIDKANERIDGLEVKAQQSIPAVPGASAELGFAGAAEVALQDGSIVKSLAEFKAARRNGFGAPIVIPSALGPRHVKETLGSAELGALSPIDRRAATVFNLTEFSDVASVIPRVDMGSSERYQFARQLEEGRLGFVTTTINGVTATGATAITVFDTNGFLPGGLIRVFVGTGDTREFYGDPVSSTSIELHTDPELTSGTTFGSPAGVDGERVTSENFGATAEEAAKPVGLDAYEEVDITLQTLAIYLTVTQQRLNSAPQLQAFFNSELVRRLRRNMGFHLLYGSGTAPQLNGLASETGAQTYLWSSGTIGDTRADAVFRAANQINTPDGQSLEVMMNKDDWLTILLAKATDGHYITTATGPVMFSDAPGQRFLGSTRVILDASVRVGDFFIGAFSSGLASEWLEQSTGSMVSAGWINDDYINNIVRLRAENRVEQAVLRVSAYSVGDWDAAPS